MSTVNRTGIESFARLVILLAIGGMAGAAAFTHVHDLTVAHGQPDWIGWANAVAVELMAIYLGLEIRARRRTGRPVGLVAVFLVCFAVLSLSAQVAEAERSPWGWTVAAVPSLAFLALVKVVLSSAPATAGNDQAHDPVAKTSSGNVILPQPAAPVSAEPLGHQPATTPGVDPPAGESTAAVRPALRPVQLARTAVEVAR